MIVRRFKPCNVCEILDGDRSLKPCSWCSVCRAWICERDLGDLSRRARAARLRSDVRGILLDYYEKLRRFFN
jgi:hypothetical protein